MKLLLVEDEPQMADALVAALTGKKILVDHVVTTQDADHALRGFSYDVVILDRRLPGGDGITLLRQWRKKGIATPVLILSAIGDMENRVEGIESGADDYLPKPFEFSELYARVKALARRPQNLQADNVHFGRVTFDFTTDQVSIGEEDLLLTRRETLALKCLIRRFGQVVNRKSLMEAIYSFDDDVQPNALDLQISRLRAKLNDANSQIELVAVRGVGYFLREK